MNCLNELEWNLFTSVFSKKISDNTLFQVTEANVEKSECLLVSLSQSHRNVVKKKNKRGC